MFNIILNRFIDLSEEDISSRVIFDTKNNYEFTMVVVHVGKLWFAVVLNPDHSRIQNIDKVISEEFDAKIIGWCVLKVYQKQYGNLIQYTKVVPDEKIITYQDRTDFGWVLQIVPERSSRLLKS